MPGVIVTIAVIQLDIVRIIGNDRAVFADLIQGVRPGITELGSQSVPSADPEACLQSVIVGGADAVEHQNGAEVRKRAILVKVGDDVQLASLAADITYLKNSCLAEALLNLQIVVVEIRYAEV